MVQRTEQDGPADLVQVGGDWYVHAASALADDRTRVLKHGDMFAVFDRYGDIQPIGLGEQGIFRHGARHLSHFDLRVGGKRPLLLSSTISEDNSLLTIDLANVEFQDASGVVPAETVHVLRTLFLWDDTCHERLDIHYYGAKPIRLNLTHLFGSDFRDLFEVRGMRRARRGRLDMPTVDPAGLLLSYYGLDGVHRRTTIGWSEAPLRSSTAAVDFAFDLEPGDVRSLYVAIRCADDSIEAPSEPADFETAFHLARTTSEAALASTCTVQTSNEQFNSWLSRSRADLLMLLSDTEHGPFPYAGIPWFSTPFGRDAVIAALEALWLQPAIAAGVLRYLAATQATEFDEAVDAAPGKVIHEVRRGEMASLGEVPFARYYGSIDATPLFVVLAGAYYEATGDLDLMAEIWPAVERALRWMDEVGDSDGDGFLEYRPNPRGLTNQGWKDSDDSVFHADGTLARGSIALCEVQAYAFAAKRAAAALARATDRPEFAVALEGQAKALQERFSETFWIESLGTFALALDGEKRPCAVRTSNAGHALLCGIASAEQARTVAGQLMSEESFSGWGVRTLATSEARYNPMSYHNGSVWPHDNALVARGLAAYGFKQDALRILEGLFAASQNLDIHRLPELICGFPRRPGAGPTLYSLAAAPQAWASGAVFLLLQACLGMTVDALERQVRIDHPALPEWLDWVRISGLRVGNGTLDLEFQRHPEDVGVIVSARTADIEVVLVK